MIDLSHETETLARRLADAQHVSVDAAVKQALEAQASAVGILPDPRTARDPSPKAAAARRLLMDRIAEEIATLPVLDPRPPHEIMHDINAL